MKRKYSRRTVLAAALAVALSPPIAFAGATPGTKTATLSVTPKQVQGPYFLPNAPWRSNLIPANMKGQEIAISGKVMATDGTPLSGATVHVWLASPTGHYDNEDAQGNAISIPPSKQVLRGRINTDAAGEYTFVCLRPGNYFLGAGQVRPAHIHVKVEAPGYKTLITQLYFTDDQFNLKDLPGDEFFQPQLLVPLTPSSPQPGVRQTGRFDFVIGK